MLDYRKLIGFTLIELLVVMTISGVLIAFVGPLAMQGVESSNIRAEKDKIKNIIKLVSTKAYSSGEEIELSFEGDKIILSTSNSISFKYLKFEKQKVTFNRNGYPNISYITFQNRNKNETAELFKILGFSNEQFVYAP